MLTGLLAWQVLMPGGELAVVGDAPTGAGNSKASNADRSCCYTRSHANACTDCKRRFSKPRGDWRVWRRSLPESPTAHTTTGCHLGRAMEVCVERPAEVCWQGRSLRLRASWRTWRRRLPAAPTAKTPMQKTIIRMSTPTMNTGGPAAAAATRRPAARLTSMMTMMSDCISRHLPIRLREALRKRLG